MTFLLYLCAKKNSNMSQEKVILVTNDDGITAKGISALVEVARQFGRVVVVAPDKAQSAMGHAITLNQPLRLNKVNIWEGIESYACSGTPVDCVKLAIDKIFHRKPDLCLSGINHGSNASINIIYSGTLSAAMEASLQHIPAIGFSSLDHSSDADMSAAQHYAQLVIEQLLTKGVPDFHLLNVNIPALPLADIQGIRVCRQALQAKWVEDFLERQDPMGKNYYWVTGRFLTDDHNTDTDIWALEHGFVSLVPVQHDLTAYDDMHFIRKNWEF
jgi:5'-nucleotidase